MKTIITAIAFILISSVCYGDYKKKGTIYNAATIDDVVLEVVLTETRCIEGYLFVIAQSKHGISIVQSFERGRHHSSPSQPIKCKG